VSQAPALHDVDAERAVVSALMIKPSLVSEWPAWLQHTDFFDDRVRLVAEAILGVDAAGGLVDVTTVAAALRASGKLAGIGGAAYLAQLIDATPAVLHVWEHARLVADKARVRRVRALALEIAAEAGGDVGDVRAWLQGAEARLFAATRCAESDDSIATFAEAVPAEHTEMLARAEAGAEIDGISTGFVDLDRRLGGLKPGCKYTVAARPGMGKSAFAESIAVSVAAKSKLGVALISLEMPTAQVVQRAISQHAGIDNRRIATAKLSPGEWVRVTTAVEDLRGLPVAVDQAGTHTVASLRSSVRRCLAKLNRTHPGVKLGLIVVDYVQIMTSTGGKGRSRDNEVSEISTGTRLLAKEFDCAVIELSQLNREVEKRGDKRPVLSDLRDSGSLEQDSFGIMFLYRDDYYDERTADPGVCEVLIRKARQGGATGTVKLVFEPECTRFSNLATEYDEYGNFADNGGQYR
jgi:replicative DNA helicase